MSEPIYFVGVRLMDIAPWLYGGISGEYIASVEFPTPDPEEMHERCWS